MSLSNFEICGDLDALVFDYAHVSKKCCYLPQGVGLLLQALKKVEAPNRVCARLYSGHTSLLFFTPRAPIKCEQGRHGAPAPCLPHRRPQGPGEHRPARSLQGGWMSVRPPTPQVTRFHPGETSVTAAVLPIYTEQRLLNPDHVPELLLVYVAWSCETKGVDDSKSLRLTRLFFALRVAGDSLETARCGQPSGEVS